MESEVDVNGFQTVSVEMDYENDSSQPKDDSQDGQSLETEHVEEFEHENEPEQEEVIEKKPKSKRWEKERRSREEKYLLIQELAAEKKRNLELQDYLNRATDNNTINTADKAFKDVSDAEYAHALALESGDATAAAKASSALIQANLAVERAMNSRMYSGERESKIYSQINPQEYATSNIISDWIEDNPEFNEDSKYYNPHLISQVLPIVNKLDLKLKNRGQDHLISTPQYFELVDTIISQIKTGKKYNRPVTASVSTARQNTGISSMRSRLTEQQKIVAAGCNMSEEQYMNWLKKYENDKERRNYD